MQSPFRVPPTLSIAALLLAGCKLASGSAPGSDDRGDAPPHAGAAGESDSGRAASAEPDAGAPALDAADVGVGDAGTTADAPARDTGVDGAPGPSGIGHVVFRLAGRWRRMPARAGSAMQDLTSALDALSPGADDMVNITAGGGSLVLTTTRFGCQDYGCLALVHGDLGAGELLRNAGGEIHAKGRAAASADGNHVVFPAAGPHAMDAYAIARTSPTTWSAPVLLTAVSPFRFHHDLAISADGTKTTFDCGDDPYGAGGTAICEASTDGTGFRKILDPGGSTNALHHPGYAPGGGTVFEGAWTGEQIWRLPLGATTPSQMAAAQSNDNTPCVLPSGSVASLWLSAPGNPHGLHELKVMSADGATSELVLTGLDIEDIGIGCGE